MATVFRLPPYPSSQTRKSLSPSQLTILHHNISCSLLQTLALPPQKRDTPATRTFVSSYAKDTALQVLQSLVWDAETTAQSSSTSSKDEKRIRKQVLLLAEKLASSSPGLDTQTLLDIAIIYSPTHLSSTRKILSSALQSTPSLPASFSAEIVPAFTTLLSSPDSSGIYGLRKISYCIASLLKSSPVDLVRPFTHDKTFILALARAYDHGLAAIARTYGGLHTDQAQNRELDEWERLWVETKVSLMDAFHVVFSTIIQDMAAVSASPARLAGESERVFELIFDLLSIPSSSSSSSSSAGASSSTPPTPFLNQSLIADYQQSYDLSRTLASALRNAAEKDARLDLLESSLLSLEARNHNHNSNHNANHDHDADKRPKNPGALKLLLRSSGIPPGIDNLGKYGKLSQYKGKGKEITLPEPSASALTSFFPFPTPTPIPPPVDYDMEVTQVLDILPDHSPEYIRALLSRDEYGGDPEKVVGALLEGTAPGRDEVLAESEGRGRGLQQEDEYEEGQEDVGVYVQNRRNVFDDDAMDLGQVRVGKKNDEETTVLQDRTFIEQMKADILRRAEEVSDEDEEEDLDYLGNGAGAGAGGKSKGKAKAKVIALAFDEEDSDAGRVRVVGDGEESENDEDGDEDGDAEEGEGEGEEGQGQGTSRQSPETICELAYIRDPKLFDRDAGTRRSKSRVELKALTGWSDEQIEGWRIMLDRNPKKDKILQKHEFAGNRAGSGDAVPSGSAQGQGRSEPSRGRGGPRGRGRGGGGRGGGGGGGGGPGGEGAGGSAKERAWKDKNKASRGNHNRKRGHDKKMSRVGGPPPA